MENQEKAAVEEKAEQKPLEGKDAKEQATAQATAQGEEKKFTQLELDEIVSKRLERERKKYGDYDELKTKITEYEQKREEKKRAEMTEMERYKTDLERAQSSTQTLESELVTLRESVKQERMRSAFLTAATTAHIAYMEDAWLLADKSELEVGEDGKVTGLEKVISTLVKDKPYLVAKSPTSPKVIGDPSPSIEEGKRTLEMQLEAARKQKDFDKVIELSNRIEAITK